MKKVLIFLLIPLMVIGFSFNAFASPPRLIDIRSFEEFIEIKKMAEAGEKAFLDYLEQTGQFSFYRFRDFNEIKTFISVLDSLPVPIINNKELVIRRFIYNFDDQIITAISYNCIDGYIYSFSIRDHRPLTTKEFIEQRYNEEAILLYQRADGNVIIYAAPQAVPRNPNVFIRFVMDFYRYFIEVTYWHEDITDYSNVCAEELLGGVTFGSIRDLEIMHERRTMLTTADALIVLRSAVGLDLLTDTQIARFEIIGVPTTADALRVLRAVVGLPSGEVGLGDVEDDVGVVTTSDALEILRAATGLATLTDAEKVRLGISGAATTADALRVLRVAVGL
jgi:hypothetical protein